jgi:hypothetical protein
MANPRKRAAEKIRMRQKLMHVSTPGRRFPEGEARSRRRGTTGAGLTEGDLTPKGLKLFNAWIKEGLKSEEHHPSITTRSDRIQVFVADRLDKDDDDTWDRRSTYERGVESGLIKPLRGKDIKKARKKAAEGLQRKGKVTLPKGSQRYEAERKFEKVEKD